MTLDPLSFFILLISSAGFLIVISLPFFIWKNYFRYGSKKKRLEAEIKELEGDLAKAKMELQLEVV